MKSEKEGLVFVQNALEMEGLHFNINGIEILKGIDLKVKKGEFVGLIGPNGAGKTTLLKCINRINNAEGFIKINQAELSKLSEKKIACEVSLMQQNTTISFPLPALDVVLMGRYPHLKRLQGESKEDFRIARSHMEYTDTTKFERKPITEISGGEKQRVIFAKVLTQEADIILLDEPTASLDITHQEQIFKFSQELSTSGKTIIAAVHDLKIASRYCSRLVLMKEGKVISDGRPDEVLTSENLSKAYGVNALVYRSKISGLLDFYIHTVDEGKRKNHIHVIGGGGAASGVIRQLFENGFKVSAGVFAHGDSDLQSAETFGIEHIVCDPFSDISDVSLAQNIEMVEKADLTILCNMPFGWQNLKNLEAAKSAQRLVIIEDDEPVARDFTGGKAMELYNRLKMKAEVTNSARLHEVL